MLGVIKMVASVVDTAIFGGGWAWLGAGGVPWAGVCDGAFAPVRVARGMGIPAGGVSSVVETAGEAWCVGAGGSGAMLVGTAIGGGIEMLGIGIGADTPELAIAIRRFTSTRSFDS